MDRPKIVKLHIERIVSLSCPECEATIDNPAPEAVTGFIVEAEWASVPSEITCPSCGVVLLFPRRLNPFRSRL